MTQEFERQVCPDGSVRISSGATTFSFARPESTVLVVTVTGYDKGQLGTAPLDEVSRALNVAAPLHLFIDAQGALGATVRVSEDWTQFFTRHASDLARVHVLVGSKAVELTVAIARHLSRTDRLVQIYSDPAIFSAQLEAACNRGRRAGRK